MKIAIMGIGGRMGQALAASVIATEGCVLAGGTEQAGSPLVGQDIGTLCGIDPVGEAVTDDPLELFTRVEAILDFTSPDATCDFAALAAQARIVHIIGTTGFDEDHEAKIEAAARHATIVKAGNMSFGVNLLTALVEQAAKALDPSFDIEVLEMHHRKKVDAPSGTALMLGQAAADGRAVDLTEHAVRSRDGITGERQTGDIGFATLRGGSVIGEHSVIFAGDGERIEITHKAEDRSLFANGAVKAALWAKGKPPGLYSMMDVLGL